MSNILRKDERIDDLEFQGLKIIQNKNKFCFGIDSIILSDFAKEIKKDSIVIDLGTGTGIIGILLCGKTKLKHITGIEIQKEIAEMAIRTIKLNNLDNKFTILNEDLKNINKIFKKESIDAIVTNPPYKKKGSGIANLNETQLISRNEINCELEDIIKISSELLKNNGEYYMVHRPDRLADIIYLLKKYKLEPKKISFVYPKIDKEPNLILIKAIKNAKPFLRVPKPIIIYNDNGEYTSQILEIYNKKRKED